MSSQLTNYYLELERLYSDFDRSFSDAEREDILDQIDKLENKIEYYLEKTE
jgi:hypothetical protein